MVRGQPRQPPPQTPEASRTIPNRGIQPMLDPKISVGFACSAFLWLVGFSLIVADVFGLPNDIGHLGIGLCCGGAVAMIRSMMCRATDHLENLFEVGRDVGRAEASEVPLQRVR